MTQATLLLIDDDAAVLSRLGDLLTEAGYRVLKASDHAFGETLLGEESPDLVLLEVAIERNAGWALLQRIASKAQVIILSQHGLEEDVVRGLDAGAIDYIPKPFRSEELLARVRLHLRQASKLNSPSAVTSTPLPSEEENPGRLTDLPIKVKLHSELVETKLTTNTPRERQVAAAVNETVVMPYDDEYMLKEAREVQDSPRTPEVSADMPLGKRLYAVRQQRRISLVQAENDLNIRMYYLQAIEEEKFTLLPGALLTETFVSRYAAYLGQDAKKAVEEYRSLHYTEHNQPLKDLGGAAPAKTIPAWLVRVVAAVLAIIVCIGLLIFFGDPLNVADLFTQLQHLLGL